MDIVFFHMVLKIEEKYAKIKLCCIEYILSWVGFELTTVGGIGTDCTSSCKSNFHYDYVTTTKAPIHNL